MATFLVVEVDADAHFGWDAPREVDCTRYIPVWPDNAQANATNMQVGRIQVSGSKASFKYANNRNDNKAGPAHCRCTVLYKAPLKDVRAAGINLEDGPSTHHFNG